VKKSPDKPSQAAGRGRHRKIQEEADDEDKPLIVRPYLNEDQKKVVISGEVWSIDFAAKCAYLAWYETNRGQQQKPVWLMKEKDTAVFRLTDGKNLEATITRRASPYLKKLLSLKKEDESCPEEISGDTVGLKFDVRANSGRNYYLMYNDYAGVLTVKVESIHKPIEDSVEDCPVDELNEDTRWKSTMSFRRVFDTSDAVKKAKDQNDNGIYMGEKSLRDIWSKEKAGHVSTVHEGDCVYKGDIRTLVGVVRWQKEGMRDLPKDYFVENLRADLLITGSSICQNPKM
jgi:hypothetical protein